MVQTYRTLPTIASGYPLDDVWAVVVPIARTNMVTNPSFETNTTSWTAIGGSIARSTTYQYHGAYSLAITPTATTTDGARYDTVSLTSGTTYAYSAKIRGVAGLSYKLAIETTGAVELAAKTFTATGRWQWIIGYYTETSSTTRRVTARKNGHASTAIFYLDGVQVEAIAAGELVSTYIDGDQLGLVPNQNPIPYYWTGTPHASTSVRSGLTRAGGMVISFKKYGFMLTAMIGLGIALPQNTSFEYARIDGGYDDYTRKPSTQFTLTGRFQGRTYAELRRNRSGLGQYFDRDLVGQDQRLTLLHHVEDRNGNIVSSEARILAKYASGFEGNMDNMHAENVPITFQLYLPGVLADGEIGTTVGPSATLSDVPYIALRGPTGAWSAMGTGVSGGTGFSGRTYKGTVGLDGALYVGGDFTAMSGVANTLHIAKFDPSTGAWSAMGTGATGNRVLGIATAPDGQIVACGDIATNFGGVANTAHLARWTGSAWQSITAAGSANGIVRAVAFDTAGNLYATGAFTTINGVAANRIAKMDTAGTWTALSTGLSGGGAVGFALAIDQSNNVYVGGDFTSPGSRVAKWDGSAFSTLGSGASGNVNSLSLAPNGALYALGAFTTAGGITASRAAIWNGVQWTALGAGLTGGTQAYTSLYDPTTNLLYVGGDFTAAGGVTTPNGVALWNGAAWVYPDIGNAGGDSYVLFIRGLDDSIVFGFTQASAAEQIASTTIITNPGTARSYPTLYFPSPQAGQPNRVFSLANATTGRTIWFSLSLAVGDTARLVLKPDQISFTSAARGNIVNTILPGSNVADFFLVPGANTIRYYGYNPTPTNPALFFRPAYLSMDDVP